MTDDLTKALGLMPPNDPYVVCWRDLDPTETRDVTSWVDWAIDRYRLDHKVIPPCWPEHGARVEELSALRTFWEACYLEDSAPSDPMSFHRDLTLATPPSDRFRLRSRRPSGPVCGC